MNNNSLTVDHNQANNPIRNLHERMRAIFAKNPFRPHRLFKGGHAQTLAAFAWPRRRRYRITGDEERLIQTEPDVQVLAHCRWQPERKKHATVIIWHGIEGSSTSNYMLSTAHKAFRAGFNVVRMNLRTCGGTEHLTSTIYHGGLTSDLRAVVKEFIEHDQLPGLLLVGFSLGGNLVLKLAGEYGENAPAEVLAICAVSPSVDLNASAELIMKRSNWLYHRDFVYRLKKRARTKHKLFPSLYDISDIDDVRTIREFDDRFTARAHNFKDVDDYYYQASSIRVIDRIRIPTLMIHAQDDPFIPFAPIRNPVIADNPYILLLAPEHGGHVAFLADEEGQDDDRFWAENRVIDFCKLAADLL